MNKREAKMKKAVAIILFICSMACMIFAGCSDGKDTYTVKQVLIDVNGSPILLDINKETLSEYEGVAHCIEYIGDKIKVVDNKVAFNGSEMKNLEGVITFDEKYNEYYISFSELPPILFKDSKVLENEIHIYIPVKQQLSYLIYTKG